MTTTDEDLLKWYTSRKDTPELTLTMCDEDLIKWFEGKKLYLKIKEGKG